MLPHSNNNNNLNLKGQVYYQVPSGNSLVLMKCNVLSTRIGITIEMIIIFQQMSIYQSSDP